MAWNQISDHFTFPAGAIMFPEHAEAQ